MDVSSLWDFIIFHILLCKAMCGTGHAKVVQSDDLHLKQMGILSTVYSGQPVGGLLIQYLLISKSNLRV